MAGSRNLTVLSWECCAAESPCFPEKMRTAEILWDQFLPCGCFSVAVINHHDSQIMAERLYLGLRSRGIGIYHGGELGWHMAGMVMGTGS